MSLAAPLAEVVVGLPVPRVFSYAVPADLAGRVGPGHRVRVPFHGRPRVGVVVALAESAPARLESIEALLDPDPALTGILLELARWGAAETASAWGEAVMRALPPTVHPLRGSPVATSAPAPEMPRRRPGPVVVGYGGRRDRLVEAAARGARETGSGVLVLAPEIETARAWAARLERLLDEPVALVTSEESPRRRWERWWACRSGAARVAVGTRVAAFLPVASLGVSIVVDEHDPAHKALDAPRWHARELAIHRARLEGGGCLLVSGAPSLESWVRIRSGEATAEEAKDERWPAVHRVDLRRLVTLGLEGCLAPALRDAVRATLAGGQSVLLLLNRLGYGRALGCAECGAVRRCPTCRVALTYHLGGRVLACRLCGVRRPAASQCGRCRGRRLTPLGWGTERLEAEARAAFPGARVARYDGEVSPQRAALVRAAFRAGEVRLLVGTQMALRLGAEAPVGLAALVLADATLHIPDFRAAERTFQLAWHLAEGVAPGGSLWLQSFYPDHPALEAVALGAPEAFYRREWAERQELGYPPSRRMARIVAQGAGAQRLAEDLAGRCRAEGLAVLGPAVVPGGRVQLVLLGGGEVPRAVARVLEPLRGRRRLGPMRLLVDIDPVELP
ncbi:MAG: primosomal protein N' [Candidatus Rokubacteria bacterium]|nr:primosomal protein N' [Candidatus Rokubacteria bacterium]